MQDVDIAVVAGDTQYIQHEWLPKIAEKAKIALTLRDGDSGKLVIVCNGDRKDRKRACNVIRQNRQLLTEGRVIAVMH